MTQLSNASSIRLGVYYDGVTFKLVSDYYRYQHARQARLDFRGLRRFLEESLSPQLGTCDVIESHLFIGYRPDRISRGIRPVHPAFARVMTINGITPHYSPRTKFGEKGVDTDLVLEVFTAAVTGRINAAVLIATDGDFVPLADRLKELGLPVVLIAFHLPQARPRPILLSPRLVDAVSVTVPMPDLIDHPTPEDRPLIDSIFCRSTSSQPTLAKCA